MNELERILMTVNHKEPDVIPNQVEFVDPNCRNKLVPKYNSNNWREDSISYAELLDNSLISAGGAGLRRRVIEDNKLYQIVEVENGAKWKIQKNPYYYEAIGLPIKEKKDLYHANLPDANDSERYKDVKKNAKYFNQKGYFTVGNILGLFQDIPKYFRNFEDFLTDLVLDEEFAMEMVGKLAEFNLKSAENLLKRGVNSIMFCDDLGSARGMLISPAIFTKYFYPHYKRLSELCHNHNAYLIMHSNGNINSIIDKLIEAGIDVLNPVMLTDGMDLGELKEKYGRQITFYGGLDTTIGDKDRGESEKWVDEVIRIGSKGGGFILRSLIPNSMTAENFHFHLRISKKYREQYGLKRGVSK